MLKNYFIITWRNLTRHRLYSAINIIGLATGMAASIVILLFVFYEKSFDSMHHKNIYRLNEVQTFTSTATTQKIATTMFPLGPTLKAEFPEVLSYCHVDLSKQYEMTYGEKKIFFPQTCFVDTAFLRMFDFPLLKGDRQTALQKPNSIVLTESAARELFGNADPIGKTVSHFGDDTLLFTVTGILKDVPANSQFQFDALQSFNTISKPGWMNRWNYNWVNTYLELAPNTNMAALEKKFPSYLKKHSVGDQHTHYELFLLPLRDVHANAVDIGEDNINFQKFDKRYTNIFIALALLVLLIACINFMNLSTARSAERGKEVGIRKSIGALRSQLGFQFLGETVLLSLIAMVIALALVSLVLPYIDKLSGRNLSPQFLDDHFKELYRTDTRISRMVGIMAGLAILISCLGLFGLASFSTEKRTREIGVRKILGASVKDVVFLLSKNIVGLVLIANLIAWPLAWLALHQWIQGFAYRVAISWWVFALAGIAALMIALGTVSFLTIKAATNNPVNSLRTE